MNIWFGGMSFSWEQNHFWKYVYLCTGMGAMLCVIYANLIYIPRIDFIKMILIPTLNFNFQTLKPLPIHTVNQNVKSKAIK